MSVTLVSGCPLLLLCCLFPKTVERMLARRGSVLYNMDRSRPDDAAGAVQIWLFREPQLAVLPQDEYGCFFEGETYMVCP